MSADLFAEFANSNPPPPQQPIPPAASQTQQSKPAVRDPFSFGFNDFTTAAASPIERWPPIQSQPSGAISWATSPALPQTAPAPQAFDDADDDGWGDFETAKPTPPAATISKSSDPFGGFSAPYKGPEIGNRPFRAPSIDIMTNTLVDVQANRPNDTGLSWNSTPTNSRFSMASAPTDSNVLFDADDFELQEPDVDEDDDEFGDFEAVAPAPMQPKQSSTSKPASSINSAPLLDLLSLDDPPQQQQQPVKKVAHKQSPPQLLGALSFGATSTLPNPPKSPSFQERNPFPDLGIKTSVVAADTAKKTRDAPKSATPVTAWPTTKHKAKSSVAKNFDDDWDAWDDTPSGTGNKKDVTTSIPQSDDWGWDAGDDGESNAIKASDDDPPPTNVPPPSVILSAFPNLLSSANAFFKPMSGHSASIKQQVLSNPKAIHFLQGYILLATTAARVIAGRKHRWHRDKILAKSMSISAAGSKGMKLAGVDKTQSAREDREAADVVAVWREHVGRVRSAVAAANTEGKLNLKVPELSENMLVQTAKTVPAGPKPCIICGLKREERVSKVDYDVEDSFGEWWVEHWGHRACKNFWVEHEQKLRQR
ncbi:uncharacterized protein TRIVIDRAFT_229937 [Trichoderma virens Gv29-8]|uniref:Serine/threonine-protein kinase ppk6 n=1 Tax=Hypocrea virens (strain Gv29-8 / FGSC 10586) TaxID=413071 RepID=G9MMR4_HYPVG|nr:uncharacterized protein TRIVIDRAFT_229937 [Trichoderma virens Gv29-8]EHK24632.1 hypothetical protein TRIVIDRAFT_229937 [Trichoderma virens Gv29-8]UKZ54900.1 hypothetical protein TrVGV298_008714 [Trichoderma virens]